MRLLTLTSNVDDPAYNDTNTTAHFTMRLAHSLHIDMPTRVRVTQVHYPGDWKFENEDLNDTRFFLSCDLFDNRVRSSQLDRLTGTISGIYQTAVYAFLPSKSVDNNAMFTSIQNYKEWHIVNRCTTDSVTVRLQDYKGRDIQFNFGDTVTVTIEIQDV